MWHSGYWGWRRRHQTHTEGSLPGGKLYFSLLVSNATLRMVLAGELGEFLFQEGFLALLSGCWGYKLHKHHAPEGNRKHNVLSFLEDKEKH